MGDHNTKFQAARVNDNVTGCNILGPFTMSKILILYVKMNKAKTLAMKLCQRRPEITHLFC